MLTEALSCIVRPVSGDCSSIDRSDGIPVEERVSMLTKNVIDRSFDVAKAVELDPLFSTESVLISAVKIEVKVSISVVVPERYCKFTRRILPRRILGWSRIPPLLTLGRPYSYVVRTQRSSVRAAPIAQTIMIRAPTVFCTLILYNAKSSLSTLRVALRSPPPTWP